MTTVDKAAHSYARRAARNWRYHMVHKLWVTKDDSVRVEPISDQAERGVYIFFDPTTWERIRVCNFFPGLRA